MWLHVSLRTTAMMHTTKVVIVQHDENELERGGGWTSGCDGVVMVR